VSASLKSAQIFFHPLRTLGGGQILGRCNQSTQRALNANGDEDAPETDDQRMKRISRIESQMDRWLTHMRAELKARRDRERAVEAKPQDP
jgi:hypothetical protein